MLAKKMGEKATANPSLTSPVVVPASSTLPTPSEPAILSPRPAPAVCRRVSAPASLPGGGLHSSATSPVILTRETLGATSSTTRPSQSPKARVVVGSATCGSAVEIRPSEGGGEHPRRTSQGRAYSPPAVPVRWATPAQAPSRVTAMPSEGGRSYADSRSQASSLGSSMDFRQPSSIGVSSLATAPSLGGSFEFRPHDRAKCGHEAVPPSVPASPSSITSASAMASTARDLRPKLAAVEGSRAADQLSHPQALVAAKPSDSLMGSFVAGRTLARAHDASASATSADGQQQGRRVIQLVNITNVTNITNHYVLPPS